MGRIIKFSVSVFSKLSTGFAHYIVDIGTKNILQHEKAIVHKNVDIGVVRRSVKGDVKVQKVVCRKTGNFVFVIGLIFEILRQREF